MKLIQEPLQTPVAPSAPPSRPQPQAALRAWPALALLAFFGLLYLAPLGGRALSDPSEARYAEIPREMNESGDYLVPRLNHVRYFEKPPLGYWMTAASLKAFGANELGARLPTALFAWLGLAAAWLLGSRLFGARAGLLGLAALGSALAYAGYSQVPELDIALSFFILAGLGLWYLGFEGLAPAWVVLAGYACLSLGCLVKGPVAVVLPGAVAVAYLSLTRQWPRWRALRPVLGPLLFVLIAAPWFIAVSLKDPGFAQFFFIHEHLQRFATKVHQRTAPAWFFLPVLFLGFFPWSLSLPSAAARLRNEEGARGRHVLFLGLWALVFFAFFSLSQSKRPPYLLPIFAPLALLAGAYWERMDSESGSVKGPAAAFAALSLLLAAALPFAARRLPAGLPALQWWTLSLPLALGAAAALACAWRGRALGAFAAMALASTAFFAGVFAQAGAWDGEASLKPLARRLLAEYRPGEKVVAWNTRYDVKMQSLSFYAGLRVRQLGKNRGELAYGASQEPDRAQWFPDDATFDAWFAGPERVYVLLNRGALSDFQDGGEADTVVFNGAYQGLVGVSSRQAPRKAFVLDGVYENLVLVSNRPFKTPEVKP